MAAKQGDAESQMAVGASYSTGQNGVGRNLKEAVRWLRKSADQGFGPAQMMLGIHYSRGLGVEEDLGRAKYWLQRGSEAGVLGSAEALAKLEKKIAAIVAAKRKQSAKESNTTKEDSRKNQSRFLLTFDEKLVAKLKSSGKLQSRVSEKDQKNLGIIELAHIESRNKTPINLEVVVDESDTVVKITLDERLLKLIKSRPIRIKNIHQKVSQILLVYTDSDDR